MIIADNETAVDLLYYEAIAGTVVRLVAEKSDEPLSVGVHGDWGAGKSSVLMMVEKTFEKHKRVVCVRFNGWQFQGFEDAKAVLIETIVNELRQKRSTCDKVAKQAKEVLRRVDWMKFARRACAYSVSLATSIPHLETPSALGAAVHAVAATGGERATDENRVTLANDPNNLMRKVNDIGSAPEQMHAFRSEFEELLKHADIDQLVVLVDDLDRCLPKTAIETLEAIRLFLFMPRVAFVIAADEGMIEYAVRQHFPDLPVTTGPATYARNYLEKLIQVPFRLPSLGHTETRIYVTLLLVLSDFEEASDTFTKIVDLARKALQRPWKGSSLDRVAIGDALGSVPEGIERALELSERITPILADGARGNPRQIKRFINTMMLRLAIAEERGFRDELKISVLAKIMLAERFAPELYDAIARGSANTGVSEDLGSLETAVLQKHASELEMKFGVKKVKEPPIDASLPDWPNLEWAKQWAAIEPPLAGCDLRPYVFVTRESSVFGAVASFGGLDELILRLQGTPLQVQQASAEVAQLETLEAERVFDALRAKIRDAEDLFEEPAGARGLAEISRNHPFLQAPLLALLKDLPVSKLGPWVVSGWKGTIEDAEAKADFTRLLQNWAQQNENRPLSAAATAANKLPTARKRR